MGPLCVVGVDAANYYTGVQQIASIAVAPNEPPEPTTGVPEPATWALMIGGFGLAGATLRRRRVLAES